MKLFILFFSVLFDATGIFASWSEAILAQGLLGSHFGVPGIPESFDYVIAGGGTAGLALARRLAANTSISVAVIEAGDFYEFSNGNFSEIPADAAVFIGTNPVQKNPLLDWYQYTERQTVSEKLPGEPKILTTRDLRVWLVVNCFILPEKYLGAAVRAISCGIIGRANS